MSLGPTDAIYPAPLRSFDRALGAELTRSFPGAEPIAREFAELASAAISVGHSCLDLAALAQARGWDAAERDAALDALKSWSAVGRGESDRPLVLEADALLYLRRYWRYEQTVARALRALVEDAPAAAPRDFVRTVLDGLFDPREAAVAGQRAAVEHALASRLTVISGGPGTGKTHTVFRLLLALVRLGLVRAPRILLAAPTGKAAVRLSESLASARSTLDANDFLDAQMPQRAITLHRLLGVRPHSTRARRDAEHPLDCDVLVVDEASMVDLPLLAKLLDALPANARLVLLGDADQLASVEVGSVLSELALLVERAAQRAISNEPAPSIVRAVVRLEHNFRAADRSDLAAVLAAVRRGDASDLIDRLRTAPTGITWLNEGGRRREALACAHEWYAALVHLHEPAHALREIGRSRVLVALREGPYGVAQVNAEIARSLGLRAQSPGVPMLGAPLLILRNDALAGLANGDVGVALRGHGSLRAWFDAGASGVRELPLEALPRWEPAFAMTVHKAQGSEFERVLVLLPDPPHALVTREWLYTALSRARHDVVLVASEEALRQALAQRSRRASGLAAALA